MHSRYALMLCVILSVLLMVAETEVTNEKDAKAVKNSGAKIVGGTPTTISQLPYLVNLRKNGRFFCGGTLVRPNFVVTAAHCVHGVALNTLTVVGGQTRLSVGGVKRSVSKIMIPSSFNINTLNMDVAVLKLTAPMTGANIQTIDLCNKPLTVGAQLQVSGWGLTRESAGTVSDVVQTVRLSAIGKQSCRRSYSGAGTLTSSMFCASVPGKKDSCQGDSGGPVVFGGRLCGIISWGIGCARTKYPGVYTSVVKVASYIRSSMK